MASYLVDIKKNDALTGGDAPTLAAAGMRNILRFQLFVVLAVVVVSISYFDMVSTRAALFGGMMAVINTLLSMHHQRRAERRAGEAAEANVRIFYQCAMERLFLTLSLFALGLGLLRLEPLALLGGFISAQAVLFLDIHKESSADKRA